MDLLEGLLIKCLKIFLSIDVILFTADNKHTMVSQVREIVSSEGLVGLYRGITLNLLKVSTK